MRHLVWKTSVLALGLSLGALGCGDSGGGDGEGNGGGGTGDSNPLDSIVYPDSLCGADGCVANGDKPKTCDPNASDPALGDCDAWRINGTFSLSAVKIDDSGTRGMAPPPKRDDDDDCPPNSKTPAGDGPHCCQRVTEQGEKPGFLLTGIELNDPPAFRGGAVGSTNKTAIEEDRYNWIMQLSSAEPGDVTIKSGLGLQNEDGSFAFAEGPFELGGEMWNKNGEWNPHEVKGKLSAEGTLSYDGQYVPEGRYFQLPLWGAGYGFTMMVLSMTGIEMKIKLDDKKVCAGYLTGFKEFDQIGELKAYLPLEPLRDVLLHFEAGDVGTSLCQITAQVPPGDCQKQVKDWGK